MIRNVHPGSRGQKGTGSRIRIRNTVKATGNRNIVTGNEEELFLKGSLRKNRSVS
jgi:hypothetical protein